MTLTTAPDLRQLYGPLIRLGDLAAYFGTSTRALRPMLRARGIEPIAIGSEELVQAYRVTADLGLERIDVLEDQADYETRRRTLTHRPDGTPRTLDEFRGVVEGASPTRG